MKKRTSLVLVLALGLIALVAKADFTFGTPTNRGQIVNASAMDGHPSITPDGLCLFLTSDRPGGSRVKSVGVNEKCLLENPGLDPKPGYFAYQNLCALMDGRYKRVEIKHEIEIKDQGIFYGIGPEDDAFPSVPLVASFKTADGTFLIAHWLPWHAQEYVPRPATIGLHLEGVRFSNPVLVDLLSGRVYNVDKMSKTATGLVFSEIPLVDYPLAIVERSQIEIGKTRTFK